MNQLDRHIEILLLSNDCVIVPGLGGFVAHHVSSCYCAEMQSFTPPLRQLGFNAKLLLNDSLLAQSYIEAYDISYPEALRRIDDEVNELKQMIQNNGFCELNDLGVLRTNEDGNLEFEPCEAGILTPWLYGLNSIDIKPLATVSENNVPVSKVSISPVVESPKPIPQLATVQQDTEDIDDAAASDSEKYVTIRISTIKHFATAAAIITALFLCAMPFGKLSSPELSKSYLDTGILYNILPETVKSSGKNQVKNLSFAKDSAAKADSAKNYIAEKSEIIEINETKVQKVKEPEEPVHTHFFSIVLASRVTKANAENFVNKLKDGGYDKAEVVSRNNGSKVIYGRFASEAEAQKFLRELRSSAEAFNEGWVMEFN